MVDEHELRQLARELEHHYHQLQTLKHTTPNPPEIKTRNSIKGHGPKTPGNWLWVHRYVTLEQNLRELALKAFGTEGINTRITGTDFSARRICQLIAWHAQALTTLTWAQDLAQELEDQARQINRWTNPPAAPTELIRQAQSSTQLLTAAHAAAAATAATGKKTDRKEVTYWGKAGYITVHRDTEGNTCYQLNEIIKHINSQ